MRKRLRTMLLQVLRECFTRNIITCSTIHWLTLPPPPSVTISSPGLRGPPLPHKSGIPVMFLWWREKISSKRGQEKSVIHWSLLYWIKLLKIASIWSTEWCFGSPESCPWTEIAFCVVLSLATTNLVTFWKWNHHLSVCSQRLLLIGNYKCYGFRLLRQPIRTLDVWQIVADGRAADYLCARPHLCNGWKRTLSGRI